MKKLANLYLFLVFELLYLPIFYFYNELAKEIY